MSGAEKKELVSKKLIDDFFKIIREEEYKEGDELSSVMPTLAQLFKVLRAEALLSSYGSQFDREHYKIAYGIIGVLKNIFSENYSLEELKQMNACQGILGAIGGDLMEYKFQLADQLPDQPDPEEDPPKLMKALNSVIEIGEFAVWLSVAVDEVWTEKLQLERFPDDGVERVADSSLK